MEFAKWYPCRAYAGTRRQLGRDRQPMTGHDASIVWRAVAVPEGGPFGPRRVELGGPLRVPKSIGAATPRIGVGVARPRAHAAPYGDDAREQLAANRAEANSATVPHRTAPGK